VKKGNPGGNRTLGAGAVALVLLAGCQPVAPPPPPPPPPPPAPPQPPPPPAPPATKTCADGSVVLANESCAQMIVIRGSANALVWYPKGRRVAQDARICLPAGARYITFQKTTGGTVTYGGGGCNKVVKEPPDATGRAGAGSGP
jgi:hypothetical protein